MVYLDGIVVYSPTLEEHVKHLRVVFDVLRQNHLYVKKGKCSLRLPGCEVLSPVYWQWFLLSLDEPTPDSEDHSIDGAGQPIAPDQDASQWFPGETPWGCSRRRVFPILDPLVAYSEKQ